MQAIVISEGKLRSISLKEVELSNIPAGLEAPRGAEVIHIARN